jgi:hypothetical protein
LNATLAPSGAHNLQAFRVDLKGSSVGFAGVFVIVSFIVLFSFSFVPGCAFRDLGIQYFTFDIACLRQAGIFSYFFSFAPETEDSTSNLAFPPSQKIIFHFISP